MTLARTDRWLIAWSVGYGAVGAASLLVPLYAVALGAGPFLVGVIAATAALAGVPGAIVWGRLASRTGRHRSFVLVSLALTAASLVAIPLVDTLVFVLAANAALWFAVSAAAPVLTLLAVANAPEGEWDRRIGLLNQWQGYGWLAGLVAGALWDATNQSLGLLSPIAAQRIFFFVLAAVAGVSFVVGYRVFPGTAVTIAEFGRSRKALDRLVRGAGRRVGQAPFSPLRTFWAIRGFDPRRLAGRLPRSLAAYFVAIFLAFTGFSVFFGPLPAYLANTAGLSTGRVFLLFVTSSAASAVFYGRAGAMATARGPLRLQLPALTARVFLFPAVAVASLLPVGGLPALVALFAAIGLTWAVIAVTAASVVTRLAPPAIRGDALGAYTALGGLATAIGSLLGGGLASRLGYVIAFGVAGVLVLCGLLVAYRQHRQADRKERVERATSGA